MSKYCPSCGSPCEDNALFCTNCGANLSAPSQQTQQPAQPQGQYPQQPVQPQAPQYQQPVQQAPQYRQPAQQQPQYQQGQQPFQAVPQYQQPYYAQPQQGMKWFKFIIYFQLFLSAISGFASGVSSLTGAQYNGDADLIYSYMPAMSVLDKLMGVASIALGVFAIVVRFRLAKFRKNGPKLYYALIILSMLTAVAYSVAALFAMGGMVNGDGTATILGQVLGQIIGSGILLVINISYFGKRAHLFVN